MAIAFEENKVLLKEWTHDSSFPILTESIDEPIYSSGKLVVALSCYRNVRHMMVHTM
jgi:hypothetical protein